MDEQIRHEIKLIEESATRLKELARDNPAILKNAEILLNFIYVLKFITPDRGKEPADARRGPFQG